MSNSIKIYVYIYLHLYTYHTISIYILHLHFDAYKFNRYYGYIRYILHFTFHQGLYDMAGYDLSHLILIYILHLYRIINHHLNH